MNFNLLTLSEAASNGDPQPAASGASLISMLLVFAVMFVAMYFFMIRPEKKRKKEEQKMRDNLQVGDEIVTIGGIYGRVISIKEDTLVLESKSDHSKITVARWAMQSNLTVHDDTAK